MENIENNPEVAFEDNREIQLGGRKIRAESKERSEAGNPQRAKGGRDTEVRASEKKKTRRSKLDYVDELYIDPREVPDGYSVEWKRFSIHGKIDDEHHLGLEMDGWEYAQPKDFPSRCGKNHKGEVVKHKDLVLMIRPKELSEEARQEDRKNAQSQVKTKLQEIGLSGQGEAPRVDGYGRPMAKVNVSYDKISVAD